MPIPPAAGGHQWIYQDLLKRLQNADIAASARHLDLRMNAGAEAEIPFLGRIFLISKEGVRRSDGKRFLEATGSALIHYVLKGSRSRPRGQFATFAQLAGPLFKQASYAQGAFELPITKRFQADVPGLLAAAAAMGGHQGGVAGLGAVSLMIDLLPHIPLQLIFYDRDNEFPARTTLLFDLNATQLIDFESLAVLATLFVRTLTASWAATPGRHYS